jgi:hypothetical protein
MAGLTSPTNLVVEKGGSVSFQMDRVLTIICAHFIHDTYSAFLAPLLPNLIAKLFLTYSVGIPINQQVVDQSCFDLIRSLWVVFIADHPCNRPRSASHPSIDRKWIIYGD